MDCGRSVVACAYRAGSLRWRRYDDHLEAGGDNHDEAADDNNGSDYYYCSHHNGGWHS